MTITEVIIYRCYPVTTNRQQPKNALGAHRRSLANGNKFKKKNPSIKNNPIVKMELGHPTYSQDLKLEDVAPIFGLPPPQPKWYMVETYNLAWIVRSRLELGSSEDFFNFHFHFKLWGEISCPS